MWPEDTNNQFVEVKNGMETKRMSLLVTSKIKLKQQGSTVSIKYAEL